MTDAELLARVKQGLGITTDFQDSTLTIYINEVKEFMTDAGVLPSVVASSASVGCILIGVNDLWNYTAGGTKFSEYFRHRVVQLRMRGEADVPTE